MEKKYKYNGIPLGNEILIEIIPKLFSNGEAMLSKDILKKASEYHIENGGKPYMGAQDPVKFISGSLNALRNRELASKVAGHWIIGKEIEVVKEIPTAKIENLDNRNTIIISDEEPPEATYGEGAYSVYVYYFPKDLERAKQKKEEFWACKIGKTKGDARKRQVRTAMPEKECMATVYKTDYPTELEKAIHHILTIRGRKIHTAPGNEWFNTCPFEIDVIYNFIINGIH